MVIKLNKKYLLLFCGVLAISLGIYFFRSSAVETTAGMPVAERTIVIDAGHGGIDGGAVSANGIAEKDINLNIAKYLKEYMVQGGAEVIMTREEDVSLHDDDRASIKNKKRSDLNKRKSIVNSSSADLFISIHLNQFQESKYKGAQVFYETNNPQSQTLATCLQNSLKNNVDSTNNRQPAKIGSDKIVFQDLKVPAVIVECGFLSNPEEELLLQTPEYQQKLALAIYTGIIEYFNQ